MNALCIIGSPRKHGSTASIVERIAAGMRAEGVETHFCFPGALDIHFCRGCHTCEETRRCVQRDAMDGVIQDLFAADIVLVASPSYWGDVTAQLKMLIDRCTPLCDAKTGETTVPAGKIGVAVAVRAGQRMAENQHIVDTIEHLFGHLGITPVAQFTVEGISQPEDLADRSEQMEAAYALGQEVALRASEPTHQPGRAP